MKQATNSKFGYPINIHRTPANMKARCRVLEQGINEGKWRGNKLELAKMHLHHYRRVVRVLRKTQGMSKKKAA